jgi:hypothetical protein
MKVKWLLVAFALVGLSIASAKTYSITIGQTSVVAGTKLKPGNYKLKIEGSKAVFLDNRNETAAEAKATVENAPKKFDVTSVYSKRVGGETEIDSITLGGTHMKVDFN